jgi:hypothetical protein
MAMSRGRERPLLNLALDEAMLDHADRHQIFVQFVQDHVFDQSMTDDEFLQGLDQRLRAYEAAAERAIAEAERQKTRP